MIIKVNNENLNDINGGVIARQRVRTPDGYKYYYNVYRDYKTNGVPHIRIKPTDYDPDRARSTFDNLRDAENWARDHGFSGVLVDLGPEEPRDECGYKLPYSNPNY